MPRKVHIATNPQMYKGVGCGLDTAYKVISNFEETIILLSVAETFSSCLIMIIFHGHFDMSILSVGLAKNQLF